MSRDQTDFLSGDFVSSAHVSGSVWLIPLSLNPNHSSESSVLEAQLKLLCVSSRAAARTRIVSLKKTKPQ